MAKIQVTFCKSQLYYKKRFENLAKELRLTTQQLVKLAIIQMLNREIETSNIREEEIFSPKEIEEYKNKYINL